MRLDSYRMTTKLTCLDVAHAAALRPGKPFGGDCPFHCPGSGHQNGDIHASLRVNTKKNCWMCGPCDAKGTAWQLAAFLAGAEPSNKPAVLAWLSEHGLEPDNGKKANGVCNGAHVVATYPYQDEYGNALFEVVRYEPKDFRQRKPDGTWNLDGVRRVLYRLPELMTSNTVYIVEGEKDADNLRAIGVIATCNSSGAGKWRPEYAESFEPHQRIIITPDNDEAGGKHARQVAESLHGKVASIKILELPGLPPKGDVSDWLVAGGTRKQLEALAASAPEFVVESEQGSTPRPVLVRLSDVEPEEVNWIWPGRIAKGKLSLVIGDPGNGKSTALVDVACRITQGAEWPDGGHAESGSVLILTAEDGLADTIRPRVEPVDDVDADSVLSMSLTLAEREDRQNVDNFLRELLGSGPVPSADVYQAARQNGFSDSTVNRAKARLGIDAMKAGQPGERGQKWYWVLPPKVGTKIVNSGNVTTFEQAEQPKADDSMCSPKIVTKVGVTTFDDNLREEREEFEL